MFVVSLLNRFHNQIARFSQTTEKYEGLRGRESSKVGTRLSEHTSRKFEYFLRQLITLTGCYRHMERLYLLRLIVAQKTWTIALGKQLTSSTSHASSRAIGLQTASPATATLTAIRINTSMSELSRPSQQHWHR